MSEGLQNGAYMRGNLDESHGRHQTTPWADQFGPRQGLVPQPSAVVRVQDTQPGGEYTDTNYNDYVLSMSSNGALSTTQNSLGVALDNVNPRTTEHDSHMEANLEWNEHAVN